MKIDLLLVQVEQVCEHSIAEHERNLDFAHNSWPKVVDEVNSVPRWAQACNISVLSVCELLLIDCLYYRDDWAQKMGSKCVWIRIEVRCWNIPR